MKNKGSKLSISKFGEDLNCSFVKLLKQRYSSPLGDVDGKPFYSIKMVKNVGFVPVFEDIPDFAKRIIEAT